MKIHFKKILSAVTAAVCSLSILIFPSAFIKPQSANAADAYPIQQFRLAISNTDNNVNASGTAILPDTLNGTNAEKWSLNYISSGVYEIVSALNGQLLTANGSSVSLDDDTDGTNQRWKIEGVQKDAEGYYLYYKITSNADSSKALTFSESGNFRLSDYSGNDYQKYKLNLDGLQGYAANCVVDGNEKAGTIGGLLGDTVFVSTTDEMMKAMQQTVPLTIVMTKDLDFHPYGQVVINSDKTVTGYYGVTLKDCQIRTCQTDTSSAISPSDNLVFRNLNFLAHESTNCMLFNIYSSRQIWIDHCSFVSKLNRTVDEVGKFIWCNSPFDGTWKSRATDFITLSYCSFYNRYWTTLFASVSYEVPANEKIRCRISLLYCFYDQCVRRCPQLGSAYGHIVSGFWRGTEGQNDNGTDEIIGGGQTDVVSQNCRFEGIDSGREICAGGGDEPYRDDNSYTAKNANATPTKINFMPKVTSIRRPENENYGYSLIAPIGTYNTKDFCLNYAKAAGSLSELKYITDSDMAQWRETTYPDFFLEELDCSEKAAVMDTTKMYAFQNVNSGYYLEIEDGRLSNGTNVAQGKNADRNAWLWKLEDAGDGYYYLYTKGDVNTTLCLDLPYGSADNGTSFGIWTNDQSDARKFKFIDNGDGSYTIVTKSSGDASCLAVASDSTEIGADVLQWERNNGDAQKWIAIEKYELLSGELIKNLDRLNSEYADAWAIGSNLKDGVPLYGDREATYTGLPSALLGGEYIISPCDAKNLSGAIAEFEAGEAIIVYAAVDVRVENIPSWLANWNKTELTFMSSSDVKFNLYSKEVSKGEIITLGSNEQSNGCVNYTVIAVKAASIAGDVNGDGSFNVADVVELQRWLLADKNATLKNWQAADFCKDDRLDVFDLCLMKHKLING